MRWQRLGRNPRAAAPDAFVLRQSLWVESNTYIRGDPTTPMINTITIL
jgi:hypothetical protein